MCVVGVLLAMQVVISCFDICRYLRLEVAVQVVREATMSRPCLQALASLPNILIEEEKNAYTSAASSPDEALTTRIHNASGTVLHINPLNPHDA